MKSLINKKKCLSINPDIKFKKTKKLYFRKYLFKVAIDVGSYRQSFRKNKGSLSYDEFTALYLKNLNGSVGIFQYYEIQSHVGDILTYLRGPMSSASGDKIKSVINLRVLYNVHCLLENKPDHLYMARSYNTIFIYGNDQDELLQLANGIVVDKINILSLSGPDSANLEIINGGKEINNHAKDFKYKIFFKSFGQDGNRELLAYLTQFENDGELLIIGSTRAQMEGSNNIWSSPSARPYIYLKDNKLITMITLMCGKQYSNLIELSLPATINT